MNRIDRRKVRMITEQTTRNALNEQQLNEINWEGIWNGAKNLLGIGKKVAPGAEKLLPAAGKATQAAATTSRLSRFAKPALWGAGLLGAGYLGSKLLGGGGEQQPQTPPGPSPMSNPYAGHGGGYGGMDPYAAYYSGAYNDPYAAYYGGAYSDPYAAYGGGYSDPYAGYGGGSSAGGMDPMMMYYLMNQNGGGSGYAEGSTSASGGMDPMMMYYLMNQNDGNMDPMMMQMMMQNQSSGGTGGMDPMMIWALNGY